jgi:hypothetical protein
VVMKKSGRMERADERRIETHEKESELWYWREAEFEIDSNKGESVIKATICAGETEK